MQDDELFEVLTTHYCTPGCPEGCDIGVVRYWRTPDEVIERRSVIDEETMRKLMDSMTRTTYAQGGYIRNAEHIQFDNCYMIPSRDVEKFATAEMVHNLLGVNDANY